MIKAIVTGHSRGLGAAIASKLLDRGIAVLGLARASNPGLASHHPELLLLDEPLSDLDPIAGQTVIRLLLDRFMTDEMTIVISSHMLHDIETVVDHIVCLEQGRIVADDALDALKERHGMNLEQIFALLAGGRAAGTREVMVP